MAVVEAALHGLGPALVAVVLATLVTARLLPPEGSWWVEPGLPRIVFVGFVLILGLCAVLLTRDDDRADDRPRGRP